MKKILTIILSLSIAYPAFSQKESSKMTLQSLKDSIQKVVEKEKIVGLMVGIVQNDSVLFSGGFGYADKDKKRLVDNKTLFRMGSNTKMLTALAILKLQEEGKINLNDEIRKIAPEIKFENRWEASDPLKVVNLLEHTSGFDDMKLNAMYTLDKVEKWDLKSINQSSLICRWRPSERFAYSNPNYNLLGYLIEKFSGKPYNQYFKEVIFDPLQMPSSNLNLYSKNPQDTKEYIVKNGEVQQVPQVTLIGGPQGALWSNSDEMIQLIKMYLRNGQPIFEESIIKDMETPRSSLGAKSGLEYGYGLGNAYTHYYNKYGMQGHNGMLGTCVSACLYNRQQGFGYIVANNSNYMGSRFEELIHTFLEQNLPKNPLKPQKLDKKSIEQYLGFYQFDSPRNEIITLLDKFSNAQTISIENDGLILTEFGGNKIKLLQTSELIFTKEGMNVPLITFTKDDEGNRVMMMNGTYYKKSSAAWGYFWRGGMLLMIVLIGISAIVAIGSLVGAIIKKLAWRSLPKRFLPILSLGVLVFSIGKLLDKQQFSYSLYKLNDINPETIWIFGGTLFFGITGIICLFLAIQSFRKNKNRWLKLYWALTYGSVFGLAMILFYFGFIGLRTWAM